MALACNTQSRAMPRFKAYRAVVIPVVVNVFDCFELWPAVWQFLDACLREAVAIFMYATSRHILSVTLCHLELGSRNM